MKASWLTLRFGLRRVIEVEIHNKASGEVISTPLTMRERSPVAQPSYGVPRHHRENLQKTSDWEGQDKASPPGYSRSIRHATSRFSPPADANPYGQFLYLLKPSIQNLSRIEGIDIRLKRHGQHQRIGTIDRIDRGSKHAGPAILRENAGVEREAPNGT